MGFLRVVQTLELAMNLDSCDRPLAVELIHQGSVTK
jgi:hypothetical protein